MAVRGPPSIDEQLVVLADLAPVQVQRARGGVGVPARTRDITPRPCMPPATKPTPTAPGSAPPAISTAATNVLDHDADIEKIPEWLGDKNIAATQVNNPRRMSVLDSPPFKVSD